MSIRVSLLKDALIIFYMSDFWNKGLKLSRERLKLSRERILNFNFHQGQSIIKH